MQESKAILAVLPIVIPIITIQGAWIFYDARKRNEKYYWLWGLFGLLNAPGSLITYLIITRIIIDKYSKNKKS